MLLSVSDCKCTCLRVITCVIFQPAASLSYPDGFSNNRQLGVPNQAAYFICLLIFADAMQQQDKSIRTVQKNYQDIISLAFLHLKNGAKLRGRAMPELVEAKSCLKQQL